jgi:putative ABC transport system permease protein
MLNDLRYALRMLLKSPGVTAMAVLALGLGIGANTSIFSVVNFLLLRPLPYKDPGQLVRVWATYPPKAVTQDATSYPDFTDWKNQNSAFQQIAAFTHQYFNLKGGNQPERILGLRVSADLFPLLGARTVQGRTFLPEEQQPGKDHVLLVGEGLWRRRFGKDPDLVGKTVTLNDESYTVIGILPSNFEFPPFESPQLYVPLVADPNRGHGYLHVVARLNSAMKLSEAQAQMNVIAQRLEQQYPRHDKDRGISLMPLQESVVGRVRHALLILTGAVGFVLLIGCANVANLLLARTAVRQKELAVRITLGASRLRLIRQLLTESVLLAFLGGTLGVLLAVWGVDFLMVLLHRILPLPRLDAVNVDSRVLGFTLLISLLTGLAFGLAPALGASKPDLNESLKEGSRSLTRSLRHNHIRSLLVVSEIALTLVLLIGSGLMLKSFLLLQQVDPGLHPDNILTLEFSLFESKYSKTRTRAAFFQQVLERLGTLPEVQSAAVVADIPLGGSADTLGFRIEGRADPAPREWLIAGFNVVSPDYFRTVGIPLLKGRDFNERDAENAPPVIVINETMAHRFWPDEDPISRRITMDGEHWYSIVGVVGNVRHLGLDSPPRPEAYICYLQDPVLWPYLSLMVRTDSNPMRLASTIQGVIWAVDKDQPIANVRTMEQILSASVAQPRIYMVLLSIFASVALILAAVGTYGVISYSVTQRTHEIGIRMALGAQPGDILKIVVGQGMILTILGILIGLAGAFGLTRVLSSLLYEVTATDPATFVAVPLFLAAVAFLACYIPARRATKVDPMVTLRYE